jgi:hypothetical protein
VIKKMVELSNNTVGMIKFHIKEIRHELDELEAGLKRDFDDDKNVTPLGWGEERIEEIEKQLAEIRGKPGSTRVR